MQVLAYIWHFSENSSYLVAGPFPKASDKIAKTRRNKLLVQKCAFVWLCVS